MMSAVQFQVNLSDLEWFSTTRSIAQPVCNSWASC